MPGERYQRYHEAKAAGGLALTMFGGSSNVSPDSAWALPQIDLHDARVVEHFRAFSRRIHAHGAALMCQVSHVGGRAEAYAGAALPPIGPSPVRETLHRAFAREMDAHDIARVVADFAEAAARCRDGGLDGIETFAGAHLIGQFLSPATNRRTDSFGGSLEKRCRFGLMVHEAIRKRVGGDFIVGMRFVIDEAGPGRLSFEDGLAIAAIFEAAGTVDFFNAILRPHRHGDHARGGLHARHGRAASALPRPRRRLQAGRGAAGLSRDAHHLARRGAAGDPRRAARHGGHDPRPHRGPRPGGEARARRGGARAPLRRRDPLHERAAPHLPPQPRPQATSGTCRTRSPRPRRGAGCWWPAAGRPGWRPRASAPSAATACGSARSPPASAGRCCWQRRRAGGASSPASSSGVRASWNGSGSRSASIRPSSPPRPSRTMPISSSSRPAACPISPGSTARSTARACVRF